MSDTFNINQSQASQPSINLAQDTARQNIDITNNTKYETHTFNGNFYELNALFNVLAERYPSASISEKQVILRMELEKKLKDDPSLKDRFLSAAKSGSIELIKVLANNSFVSVPLEIAKGWIEANYNSNT
jgi:hypothetical protein